MRTGLVVIAAAALLAGCGKKAAPEPAAEPTDFSTGFVAIDLGEDEELDELFGTELLQATAECGDLVALEPAAMMGKLEDAQIRCLDGSVRTAERQTVKDKISRVLMADAWAKADKHRWEGIVRRHLTEIDRSDPDLCYKFAVYLSQQNAEQMHEAMQWADTALENRTKWQGSTHVKRVNSLYKVKALSAQRWWSHLEEEFTKEPSPELETEKDQARNEAKNLAREWLDYARNSGVDITMALQLCVSTAGTENFCVDG